jgi:sugar O-acyltransferase (sialic acid O-acetyltransferase NeuD family)
MGVRELKKIIVVGSGGHAGVVIDLIEQRNEYSIFGILDSFRSPRSSVWGYNVIGDEAVLLKIKDEIDGGIVAIGDNQRRKEMVQKLNTFIPNFKFFSIVHPSAVISKRAKIGDGTVVMSGAVVSPHTFIGEQCILNTNSSVDHDCVIGNYVSIAPGATLGGNVKVGDATAISLGSNIIHSLEIGEQTIIGAGATVLNDIDSNKVAYGTPAKVIRSREKGDRYL